MLTALRRPAMGKLVIRHSDGPRVQRMRKSLGVVGAIAALVLTIPSAATAHVSPSSVPQLTLAQGEQAFGSTWTKFDNAFAQGQLSIMANYSTPNVFEAASFSTGCGCVWTTPHSQTLFSVPIEHSYPISFLAQISTPAPHHSIYSPYVTLVVFTKATAHARWLVAYLMRYAGDKRYLKSSALKGAPPATFPVYEVNQQITRFFTSVVTTGTSPADDTWPRTGSTGQELQNYLNVSADVQQLGDRQLTEFNAVDNSVAFAYPEGDIVCASYMSISRILAPTGAPIVQPSDQNTWGGMLAPGSYSSLTKLGMHSYCYSVITRANAHRDEVNPISFFGSVYQITGVPKP